MHIYRSRLKIDQCYTTKKTKKESLEIHPNIMIALHKFRKNLIAMLSFILDLHLVVCLLVYV